MSSVINRKVSLQDCQRKNCEDAYIEASDKFSKLLRKMITRPDNVSEEQFVKEMEKILAKFMKSLPVQSLYKCTIEKCPSKVDALVKTSARAYKGLCTSGSVKACEVAKGLKKSIRTQEAFTQYMQTMTKVNPDPKCMTCSFPV